MARPLRSLGVASLGLLLSPLAAAQSVLSIHTPCADCPSGVGPEPVPVTAQLQELVVCSATVTKDAVAAEITGFACADAKSTFVSTYVPAVATDGSITSTLVTEVDQLITVSYSSSTSTITSTTTTTSTVSPTETVEPRANVVRRDGHLVVTKEVEVIVYDVVEYVYTTRYRDCGRHAFEDWEGSGLCTSEACGYDYEFQPIFTKECHNGNCVTYECKWKYSSREAGGSRHGWYKEVIREEFEIEYPSPFPPAPVGCENVNSYYRFYDEYLEIWVWRSAWYTVPIIFGFPTQYPPGSCSYCEVPPGWGTTVIIIPGLTPVTTTITVPTTVATQTVTVTGGAQPTNPVGTLSCPASDRTVYTTPDGSTFLIQCGVAFTGPQINARAAEEERSIGERGIGARQLGTTPSFAACIDLCDKTTNCLAAVFFDSGACNGYSAITGTAPIAGASAATLIAKGTSTTSATTVASTSASAGATSTAASVSQTSGAAASSTSGDASQTTGAAASSSPGGTTSAPTPQSTDSTGGVIPQSTDSTGGPIPQPTDSTGGPIPQPTGTGTGTAPQPTGTNTGVNPQPTNGPTPVNPSTPLQINVQALQNGQATTVNGQPAFAFAVPAGGTARVAGEAPIPAGVTAGDGVQITFDAQVGVQGGQRRRQLSKRQNGADTGCDISASANGVTVFSSPLGDGGGEVQTFASSSFEATDELIIEIVTVCDEGRSVNLVVSAIGLAVVEAVSSTTSATSTTASSTTSSSVPATTTSESTSAAAESTSAAAESTSAAAESTSAAQSTSAVGSSTSVAQPTTTVPVVTTSLEPTTMQTSVTEPSTSVIVPTTTTTTTDDGPQPTVAQPNLVMARGWKHSARNSRGRSRRRHVMYADLQR